jgi:hypothetical protein
VITRPAGKRKSGKRSPNLPTPISESPTASPVIASKWQIGKRASQRKKRKSLRIDPPIRSAKPSVVVESGDAVGPEIIYEEPISIDRPNTPHLPLTPARQGPVRTRPYEAPYFFPVPGSPEAVGYMDRVREDRRSALAYPDLTPSRSKQDLKGRSCTLSSLEKDGSSGNTKPHDEVSGKKRPKSAGKGLGTKSSHPSSSLAESDVHAKTPTLRKSSAPAHLSSPDILSTQTTPPRHQVQRQGSLAIMRMLGKH